MDLDIAVDSEDTGVMTGMFSLFLKSSDSKDFVQVPNLFVSSQSVSRFSSGAGKFGAAGYITTKDASFTGVAVSLDKGASFQTYDIATNSTEYPARYGAFPTDSTWYVSTGTWPIDDLTLTANKHSYRLSQHITVNQNSHKFHPLSAINVGEGLYTGNIMKTTDGGNTFTEVLNTKGMYYFNAISCADANNCVAVAENGDSAVGYRTSDGGANWEMVVTPEMNGQGVSMMSCYMISATEYWLGGGEMGKTGYFWHGVGDAKPVLSTLKMTYATDMNFDGDVGYAAVLGLQTCGCAKYA